MFKIAALYTLETIKLPVCKLLLAVNYAFTIRCTLTGCL